METRKGAVVTHLMCNYDAFVVPLIFIDLNNKTLLIDCQQLFLKILSLIFFDDI